MTISGAVIAALGAILVAVVSYLGVRFTGLSARAANSEANAEAWNAAYRSTAEKHLHWDLTIMNRLQRVEQTVGIDEPIPEPPPLFPANPPTKEK